MSMLGMSVVGGIIAIFGLVCAWMFRQGRKAEVNDNLENEQEVENEATKICADVDRLNPDSARQQLLDQYTRK